VDTSNLLTKTAMSENHSELVVSRGLSPKYCTTSVKSSEALTCRLNSDWISSDARDMNSYTRQSLHVALPDTYRQCRSDLHIWGSRLDTVMGLCLPSVLTSCLSFHSGPDLRGGGQTGQLPRGLQRL